MNIFGFELVGTQVMGVKCPNCGKLATITFVPSEHDFPIPFPKEFEEVIKSAGLERWAGLPKCDDLHFFCMNCCKSLRRCEVEGVQCKLTEILEGKEEGS